MLGIIVKCVNEHFSTQRATSLTILETFLEGDQLMSTDCQNVSVSGASVRDFKGERLWTCALSLANANVTLAFSFLSWKMIWLSVLCLNIHSFRKLYMSPCIPCVMGHFLTSLLSEGRKQPISPEAKASRLQDIHLLSW